MTKVLSAALLAACLSGCAGVTGASGLVTGASGLATDATGVVTSLIQTKEQALDTIALQRLANSHNVLVGAQQILSSPTMVMMVPVVGAISTTMTVVPVTGGGLSTMPPSTPVGPPTVLSPTIPGTFPTGPVVTPPVS